MVFVRQPSDVDLGESPSQGTHTHTCTCTHACAHTQVHTHTNTHIHSHVNICGDSSRRRSSRSEPHLLLDLPHTQTHMHTHRYSYFTLGPNQTWPSLSSPHTLTTNTHTHKYAQKYTRENTRLRTSSPQKNNQHMTAAAANQSWLVGPVPTLCQLLKRKNTHQH